MSVNANIVHIVAGFIIGMLFTTTETSKQSIKGSGGTSFNDSCIDNLERLRQALLKSPYEISEDEGKELTQNNKNLFHKKSDIPKCLQLRDFSKWQPVILQVRYHITEKGKEGKHLRVYYNLPILIEEILNGNLTHDPITNKPILHERQTQASTHHSLYLLTLIEEHVKRQLSVSHHLYNWYFTQEGKLDILSALLTRFSLLKKMLYTGTKLYQLYSSDKDDNKDELTLIDFLDDVEMGDFDPNNIQTLTRVIPTDVHLEPYPFVITDSRMSTSSTPSNLSGQQRKTHQRVLKKFKKYMINFREIPDELLQCRDQPLTPRR